MEKSRPRCLGWHEADHVCDGGLNPKKNKAENACGYLERCLLVQRLARGDELKIPYIVVKRSDENLDMLLSSAQRGRDVAARAAKVARKERHRLGKNYNRANARQLCNLIAELGGYEVYIRRPYKKYRQREGRVRLNWGKNAMTPNTLQVYDYSVLSGCSSILSLCMYRGEDYLIPNKHTAFRANKRVPLAPIMRVYIKKRTPTLRIWIRGDDLSYVASRAPHGTKVNAIYSMNEHLVSIVSISIDHLVAVADIVVGCMKEGRLHYADGWIA